MALVLIATGLFVYLRLQSELDRSIDDNLRSRADEVSALVTRTGAGLRGPGGSRLSEQEESFAQVLDGQGRVVDYSSPSANGPILTASELSRAQEQSLFVNHEIVPGVEDSEARLLATPAQGRRNRLIVVVGASVEDRNDTLANLGTLLLIGGPITLLLTSLAGYGVASASLRPVERMRQRAAAISAAEPSRRLPVPPADDEIGRLGHTLNAMLARLETALKSERRFVADASHELRTPIAVLKTELELALRRGRSLEELEAALRSAVEETDRLLQLSEDLLVIARSDQGKLPVRLTPVDAGEVLADVRERFVGRSLETRRQLVTETTDGLRLTADPHRLRQALGNMVDNALRYGQGPVRLSAHTSNGRVEFHVADEGPGFPPAFLKDAFERFTRADEGRGRGGTGLGLAIVEAIARAHHGEVGAVNRPGGGADVWLALPVHPGKPEAPSARL